MTKQLLFLGLLVLVLAGTAPVAYYQDEKPPEWLGQKPGMQRFDKKQQQWVPVKETDHPKEADSLKRACACLMQVPFKLPKGTTIIPGVDDKEFTKERTNRGGTLTAPPSMKGMNLPHEGIDIGSRVSTDGGKTLGKLGKANVRPIVKGGFVQKDAYGEIQQKVLCQWGEAFRAIIVLDYGHTKAAKSLTRNWKPITGNDQVLGKLDGDDNFNSLDPALTKKMKDKGNHIHLAVLGLCVLDTTMIKAHNNILKGKKVPAADSAKVKARARFFNDLMLPMVTGQKTCKQLK